MYNINDLLVQYNSTHTAVDSVSDLISLMFDIEDSIVDHLQDDTPDDITFDSEVVRLTGFTTDQFDWILGQTP